MVHPIVVYETYRIDLTGDEEQDCPFLCFNVFFNFLRNAGLAIERYNAVANPQAFLENQFVLDLIDEQGDEVLPIVMCGEDLLCSRRYPTRDELCKWFQLSLRTLI